MSAAAPAPTGRSRARHAFAAATATVAWVGLVLNAVDVNSRLHGLLATAWSLLGYFTILANLAVALVFSEAALRPDAPRRPRLLTGVTLAILLVGIVFQLLLRGEFGFTTVGQIADILLHNVTPLLVPVFWALFVPKGHLRGIDPLLWALFPLGYFAYALVRGAATGFFPYGFIDVGRIGWARTGLNALLIAAGFMAVGYAVVWLDAALARRRPAS